MYQPPVKVWFNQDKPGSADLNSSNGPISTSSLSTDKFLLSTEKMVAPLKKVKVLLISLVAKCQIQRGERQKCGIDEKLSTAFVMLRGIQPNSLLGSYSLSERNWSFLNHPISSIPTYRAAVKPAETSKKRSIATESSFLPEKVVSRETEEYLGAGFDLVFFLVDVFKIIGSEDTRIAFLRMNCLGSIKKTAKGP